MKEENLTNEEYKVLKEALKSNESMTELKSKEQRALEIIKRFTHYDIYFLNYMLNEKKITQEEFDLLIEVLL